MATRFGVDVGGTFTDLVFYDDQTGDVRVGKTLTNAVAPDEGVNAVVAEVLPDSELDAARFFVHGTTVGINALLERSGALVGLLTTHGFRDVLEARRGDRDSLYDLTWQPAPVLVERRLRLPVTERVRADGSIDTPFEPADVREALALFEREGVEAIAVVFLNAYANPVHELEAARLLRELGFEGEVTLSHQVSGEYREYERTATSVIDAYVRPKLSSYMRRLERRLRDRGFDGECLVTRSGGGALTFEEAAQRPFETIMSGPVGGAVGAGEICRELGIDLAVTADVGGTSFDTCLITDGYPEVKYEGRVAGLPLQCPWVDVRSIGAGGGSIAAVDAGGLLKVGPRSAGSTPGPVCYGRGGTEPTVTDAAAVLGMLADGELAGGTTLSIEAAHDALSRLGAAFGRDALEAARGVVTVAVSAMGNAMRSVSIEQGRDPREAALIAFGGAGPVLATMLAREIGIRRIVVPAHAGNFSAWGLLGEDITATAARTCPNALDSDGLVAATETLHVLFDGLGSRRDGRSNDAEILAALDLRYVGQEYTLTVDVPLQAGLIAVDAPTISRTFVETYERTYGHSLQEPIEIVTVRATTREALPRRAHSNGDGAGGGDAGPRRSRTRDAYSFTQEEWLPFAVLQRADLGAGAVLPGPAVILEPTSTTYLDAGFEAHVASHGWLVVTDEATP